MDVLNPELTDSSNRLAYSGPRRCWLTDLAPPLAFVPQGETLSDRVADGNSEIARPAYAERPTQEVGSMGQGQEYHEEAAARILDTLHIVAESAHTGDKALGVR